jgi:hypothetical protein
MQRLGPPLLGVAAVGVFVALVSGGQAGPLGGFGGVLLLAAGVWLVARAVDRRRPAPAGGWTHDAAVTFHPAAGHVAASPGGVAMALSRVEVREMVSSASIGVGLGFCLLILVLLGQVWAGDYRGGLTGAMELYPIYVHPLAGLVVLAAHRARTRSRRDGTDELFDSCPTAQATRTTGHLLTAWAPAAIALGFLSAMTALLAANTLGGYGGLGARQVAALLGAALLCVGATVLGVALARWAPWMLVPVAAVVAIGFGSTRLATAGDHLTEPLRQLSTWLNEPEEYLPFTAPHWAAHHVWILALVGLVSVLALSRDVRRPRLLPVGACCAAVAVISGVAATRPIDTADAVRIAAMINEPEAHQRCVDAAGLPVCTYGADRERAQHIADVIAPVVRAAPDGALRGWAVRQDTRVEVTKLDPAVRRRLVTPRSDRRYIPMQPAVSRHESDEGARFWVALTATGITEDIASTSRAVLDGTGGDLDVVYSLNHQARGVVALWLATRGVDAGTAAAMTSSGQGSHDSSNFTVGYARPWPDVCYAGPAPVTWALTDIDAARRLLELPEVTVRDLLHGSWARFTDRATSTDELLAAVGLDPVPPRPGTSHGGGTC